MRRREFVKATLAASVSARSMMGQKRRPRWHHPRRRRSSEGRSTACAGSFAMDARPAGGEAAAHDAAGAGRRGAYQDILLHPGGAFNVAAAMRGADASAESRAGALIDAGAPEFLDFLISVSPADQQKMYVDGLNRLDAEAKQQFGIPFAGVKSATGRRVDPAMVADVDDRPPADRSL